MTPLISIIIPCYNQGAYVWQALESVSKQKFNNYETIIINDGSTCPETNQLLLNFSYPKTTVYHTENQGLAMARNHAIQRAQGKYILPLDADDLIGPHYLSQAIPVLEADDQVGIVYCRGECFGIIAGPMEDIEFSIPQILTDNMIFCSGFFRKDDWVEVGGYNKEMIYGLEDYDFWLKIISLNRKVVRLPDCHFYYRIKRKSMLSNVSEERLIEMRLKILKNHRHLYIKYLESVFHIMLIEKIRNQRLYRLIWHRIKLYLGYQKNRIQFFVMKFKKWP